MKDENSTENPAFNKDLDEAHQQLLMDEEFQQMRTAILRSLDNEKKQMLHQNEQDYIKEHITSPQLDNNIRLKYTQRNKKTAQKNKKSLLSRIMAYFSFANAPVFTLPNIGLVTMSLLLGIVLVPQWGTLFVSHETSEIEIGQNNKVLSQPSYNEHKSEQLQAVSQSKLTPGTVRGITSFVEVVEPNSRGHLQSNHKTAKDYMALAESVSKEIIASALVKKFVGKPRVIVTIPINNSENKKIRMADFHDRIQETLLESGYLRLMDKSATRFEYIIKSEFTSTSQGGRSLAYYILTLKMFTFNGELVGQWSDYMVKK